MYYVKERRMRQKLLLSGKTSLFMQRISIIISLVLVVLTIGNFFLKTFTIIDDSSAGQKNAENKAVAITPCTIKVTGNGSSGSNDKSVFRCLNSPFQNSAIQGKEYSYSYFVSDHHWDNDDGSHYDEEDIDVYNEEDRENECDRETAKKAS